MEVFLSGESSLSHFFNFSGENRSPILAFWGAVVAEVLGFEHDEALALGRAVAGLNAYSKGVSLGHFQPTPTEV